MGPDSMPCYPTLRFLYAAQIVLCDGYVMLRLFCVELHCIVFYSVALGYVAY